jgi:integrase
VPSKKTKRGNGEGSIYQRRDGRWVAQVTRDDGPTKYYYGQTRDAVKRKLTQALHDQQEGLPLVSDRQTVAQYLEQWLTSTAQHRLRPRTYVRYQQLVRTHALPTVGKLPLPKLTPQHLSTLYSDKLAVGLSPRSVQFLHAVLHSALKQALLWGLIVRNPADAVKAPRPSRYPMRALDQAQTRALLDTAAGDPLEALYVLALMTGMRQGELLGLQWADVDFDSGRLTVRHTLQWVEGGRWSLDEPKTGHSRRSIRLPATALHALKVHRAQQVEQRLVLGPAWAEHDLVFCNTVGRPLQKSNLLPRSFRRLLRRAGLPRIRFHDLRHTYATLALMSGVPVKVVSETLGHASITLTLDTYSHVLPDMQEDAAARMDALLGRRTGS